MRQVGSADLLVFVHGSAEMYGSDKVLLNLVRGVAAGGDFRPVVVLHEDGPLRHALTHSGAEVHVATVVKISRAMFTPAAPWTLWRLARSALHDLDRIVGGRRVALVHSNTLAVLGGALWAWRRGHRHLWHVHEIILRPALVRRALPWLAERLSHRVISNSSPTQQWLLEQAPALSGRARVVFNGLPDVPPPDPAAARAFRTAVGAAEDDVVATVAGRINHWKGQGLLVEALALLRQRGQAGALRVAIVGDVFAGHEDLRSALRARVDALALNDRVSFLPFVDDIYAVWQGSQIAVVPSTEPEPFGMVAIEAMACGLPVVAAAHGGLLDIVEDGSTGLLFAPRDAPALAEALQRLVADPALRQRLGRAGAQRQRDVFSLQSQMAATRAAWREAIAS